jgi:hypothetical protein
MNGAYSADFLNLVFHFHLHHFHHLHFVLFGFSFHHFGVHFHHMFLHFIHHFLFSGTLSDKIVAAAHIFASEHFHKFGYFIRSRLAGLEEI